MILKTILSGKHYQFKSVKDVMAKANEEKSGDTLAGIAAHNMQERVAAKVVLSQLTLNDVYEHPAVDYDHDEVTRMIIDDLDPLVFRQIKGWTFEQLREWLLATTTTNDMIHYLSQGLTSEMIAGVCKLMTNLDLITAAKKIINEKTANTTIGRPGTFSSRLQPNHPTDNLRGIMASTMEGLSMGIGDAVIGLNPVNDTVSGVTAILNTFNEFVTRWQVPTQTCVLAHVTTQMQAIEDGAPAGLIFQSIAGSQKANTAFGIDQHLIAQANQLGKQALQNKGQNVMYFETGQGSELSSDANFGADQVTMEARCYGFARHFDPFIVNTVVGFIGPEYLYDAKQVTRAGLEDHFMGKLSGLAMGCDVCYTNHMKADQNDIENLALLLANAGCTYIMGVPQADDVMLNYQSTGFQETATIRELLNLHPIPEFETWMEKIGISQNGRLTSKAGDASIFMEKESM
ncbi:ethanolamine ammonia-lyase subunit EutB [Lentilactobacillus hilgardii]|uniref:ethanolamine ammonia-lyase subunit EutB n=1 Tax=Lentilactobacillus hilgardii TaxID=1588 RepID=UPI0021C3B2C7|nr:ethanolamine ammonia-lyase subunit EutB [Lentilactobacillus hilgardii]MCP9332841.1 ethanolamine ammonia-lyase subunit EutB [Lentilactobacillus hilgardii]MCP9349410.1 ethanolamine ammonia-lyase subunit EutB [Lentilactobacillus hilgardii]MCP9352318.1 ethanolamine ammonia-lyase subunit EutB [Lentilactobacillus hilgardii]